MERRRWSLIYLSTHQNGNCFALNSGGTPPPPLPKDKTLVNADENKSEEKPRKVKKISIAMVNDIFGNMGEYKIR